MRNGLKYLQNNKNNGKNSNDKTERKEYQKWFKCTFIFKGGKWGSKGPSLIKYWDLVCNLKKSRFNLFFQKKVSLGKMHIKIKFMAKSKKVKLYL